MFVEFLAIAALELVLIATIFALKDLLHIGIMLAAIFLLNSLMFLILGQPLMAIIQLFILIGGITTYFVIGVASTSYSKFPHTNAAKLAAVSIILFAAIAYPMHALQFSQGSPGAVTGSGISNSISAYLPLFYMLAIMLFAAAFGSIILFKRIGRP